MPLALDVDARQSGASIVERRLRPDADIEYLRAAAILFVLLMHQKLLFDAVPIPWLERLLGYIHPATGVDLFFVISGLLIGRSFTRHFDALPPEAPRGRLVAAFWLRRFYRLYPALALWLGLTMAGNLVSGDASIWLGHRDMFVRVMASFASLRNFAESFAPTQFGYLWSLSLEIQFYLGLPLFALACPPRWRPRVLIPLCVLAAFWRPGGETWWMFRFDGMLEGLLLAGLLDTPAGAAFAAALPAGRGGRLAYVLGLGAIVLTAPEFLERDQPLAWAAVNLAGTGLVFAAAQGGFIPCWRGLRPALLWIGARSYAIYLCHIPVWVAVVDVFRRWPGLPGGDPLPRTVIGAALIMACAEGTYRWVELPFRLRGRERARAMLRG